MKSGFEKGCFETVYRAGWVAVSAERVLKNGFARVCKGKIVETGVFSASSVSGGNMVDCGPGILFPGLVNCHAHLELSFLKDKLDTSKGFRNWVRDLIKFRNEATESEITARARYAAADMMASGTVCIGDISSLGYSNQIFVNSEISGIGFHEFLGNFEPEKFSAIDFEKSRNPENQKFSLAAHAPHSTSPQIIRFLKKMTLGKGLPFSIHLDESDDERKFIQTGKGEWAEFLKDRGIDFSGWQLPAKSPVAYAEKLGIIDSGTLFVHLLGVSQADIDILGSNNAAVCLCPRSNMNLHGILPDIMNIIKKGIRPCLGTDSLASVNSLDLFDEIRFAGLNFQNLAPSEIFEMATINGAVALGFENFFGTLDSGKSSIMVYLNDDASNTDAVFEKFVFSEKRPYVIESRVIL